MSSARFSMSIGASGSTSWTPWRVLAVRLSGPWATGSRVVIHPSICDGLTEGVDDRSSSGAKAVGVSRPDLALPYELVHPPLQLVCLFERLVSAVLGEQLPDLLGALGSVLARLVAPGRRLRPEVVEGRADSAGEVALVGREGGFGRAGGFGRQSLQRALAQRRRRDR